MSPIDLSGAKWEKSSYSDGGGGTCVEFSRSFAASDGIVPVRDSKDPYGPALAFGTGAWAAFLAAVRSGG